MSSPKTMGVSMEEGADQVAEPLVEAMRRQLRFQKRWRTLMMVLYVAATLGALVCTGLAGLLAERMSPTACLATTAFILVGMKEGFGLRERWKLHGGVVAELDNMNVEFATGLITLDQAVDRYTEVTAWYASQAPSQGRGD